MTFQAVFYNKATRFTNYTINLPSFPLFVGYIMMILLSRLWMRFIPRLNLRLVMVVYNAGCCLASVFILYRFGVAYTTVIGGAGAGIYTQSWNAAFRAAFRLYHLSKRVELTDTALMIARHRVRQLTLLHVFHHASMLLLSDSAYTTYPWPAIGAYFALNAAVHAALYAHYGWSAWASVDGASASGDVAWKRRLTQAQIAQFGVGMLYSAYGYAYHGFCVYSMVYGAALTALFFNFYYHAYMRKRHSKTA